MWDQEDWDSHGESGSRVTSRQCHWAVRGDSPPTWGSERSCWPLAVPGLNPTGHPVLPSSWWPERVSRHPVMVYAQGQHNVHVRLLTQRAVSFHTPPAPEPRLRCQGIAAGGSPQTSDWSRREPPRPSAGQPQPVPPFCPAIHLQVCQEDILSARGHSFPLA